VCADSLQLYIADCDKCVIWRMKVDGTSVDRWTPDSDENNCTGGDVEEAATAKCSSRDEIAAGPKSMSVRSVGRLLVVAGNRLTVYSHDGSKLRQVELPEDMDVRHAVETRRETFIVCSTGRGSDTEHDQVSQTTASDHFVQKWLFKI
jgi:sugar lactone lactonase YvrE